MTRIPARITVPLLALALGLGATAAPALASSPPRPTPGQAAAGWLARQMVNGTYLTDTFGGVIYPAQGLTIDGIYAFAATGTARGYASRAISWLARPHILSGYIGTGTESYAGATAKLMLGAEVAGQNPAAFGGVNLPARLAGLLTPSGRYSDHSKFGDFSNAFSQALAVIATRRLGNTPASAVRFLASSECADGGFPLDFAQASCVSNPDATAMDVQALLAVGRRGPANRGLRWLASVQQPDGGFIAPPGTTSNSNSTGLAGEAFAAGGWSRQAASARKFLLSVQIGCSGKAANRGAIAFDASGLRRSTATSATAQGTLGLAGVSLARLSISGARPGAPQLACPS